MTTGLSYDGTVAGTTSYVDQIATMAVVSSTDPNFQIILPQAITYAENRMYRDLDLLQVSGALTALLTAGVRSFTLPAVPGGGTFVISEQINVITPAGTTNPDDPTATRTPLLPTTKEFLDQVYGSAIPTYAGLPTYYAPFNDDLFYVGPFPDAGYTVEIVGTVRPDSMSATNKTTFLSLNFPDLLIMASMIYVAGYQRNFSSTAANDPQMPVNYETQYTTLLKGASSEEARKKYEAAAWTSQGAATSATPTRG
jgi:hypothetical protein